MSRARTLWVVEKLYGKTWRAWLSMGAIHTTKRDAMETARCLSLPGEHLRVVRYVPAELKP